MTNHAKNLMVALDIGTTKICAVAGYRNEHGKMEIVGVGKVSSEGVTRGVVTNIEKTVKAISDAVSMAEQGTNARFKVVHVGIAGQHIKSLQHHGILTRENTHNEIAQRDIEKLVADMYKLVLPPGDKIIHVIPQEYTVDNEQGITDPIGMSGVRLEANFHIITGQITASNNIYRCVEKSGLNVASLTLEPIASSLAVLTNEEREAGVALVDMGGGTTDIAIFHDGIIRHTAVIPFGGNAITKDIKEGCTVMQREAEKLKVRFGSALTDEVYDNRIITIPGLMGREPKEISEKNLARIIQARTEEIFEYVMWEIKRSGFDRKLVGGIVLTGGGALLHNIDKLCELSTGMTTRLGIPAEHLAHGTTEQLYSPIYSTAVGLLMKAADTYIEQPIFQPAAMAASAATSTVEQPASMNAMSNNLEQEMAGQNTDATLQDASKQSNKGKWYEDIFRRTKEWFESEPDSEF